MRGYGYLISTGTTSPPANRAANCFDVLGTYEPTTINPPVVAATVVAAADAAVVAVDVATAVSCSERS